MFDLHILNHPAATHPDWYQACLESAQAAEQWGMCTVHIVESPSKNIGANRAAAYRLGQHPLVACLDNDDLLLPEGIPPLLQALADRPDVCGVYSDRQQIDENGSVLFDLKRGPWSPVNQLCLADYPHQLAIYRREGITPFLEILQTFPEYGDFVIAGRVTHFGPWLHVPSRAYQRREKPYYVHHRRLIAPDLTQRARELVSPFLLRHARSMNRSMDHSINHLRPQR